ncbi:MAG: hypothetical protein NZ899_12730 [Thermoguttaceae bacterium]|nr:hypothetical protein [Thermoguttaceae bacterium]MDW8080081.1 hypothetical protein [Thermoguttaceae bacterium]
MSPETPKEQPKRTPAEDVLRPPGVCFPWEEKAREFPPIKGDEKLVRQIWEELDTLAYLYIWQCLLSF